MPSSADPKKPEWIIICWMAQSETFSLLKLFETFLKLFWNFLKLFWNQCSRIQECKNSLNFQFQIIIASHSGEIKNAARLFQLFKIGFDLFCPMARYYTLIHLQCPQLLSFPASLTTAGPRCVWPWPSAAWSIICWSLFAGWISSFRWFSSVLILMEQAYLSGA